MRLLHTADWHVGRAIRGRSRAEEFHDALDEVVGIATTEGVDAVLVAGDVWEHRVPSPEAGGLVSRGSRDLQEVPVGGRPDRLHHVAEIEPRDVVGQVAHSHCHEKDDEVESRPAVDDPPGYVTGDRGTAFGGSTERAAVDL